MFLHVIVTLKLAFTKFESMLIEKGGLGVGAWSFWTGRRVYEPHKHPGARLVLYFCNTTSDSML